MTNKELLALISLKPWVNVQDIMNICNCGKNNATKIRKAIEAEIKSSGKYIPPSMTKYVPTKLLVEYIGLDVEYISKMASMNM